MIPVARRLELLGIDLTTVSAGGFLADDSPLGFKLSPALLLPLMRHHQLINFEYNVLCSQLSAQNLRKITDEDKHTKEQLLTAYQLAQLLEALYFIYLIIPREAEKFYDDKACLRQYLQSQGYQFNDNKFKRAGSGFSLVKKTRDFCAEGNFWRLLSVRLKRVLDAIAPLAPRLISFVHKVDDILNPVFSFLGWTFYIPRLLVNIYGTVKHTLPGPWMSTDEKNLDWLLRLRIQLERRWFELANDTVWVAVGIITCFVLVNALAPIGLYLTVGFYAYDIFLAAIRAHIELGRLETLQTQYQAMSEEAEPEDKASILSYQKQLEVYIHYQKMRFNLSIATTSLLFIGMCLTAPFIAVTPLVLLAALSFITAVCLASYIAGKYIERYKPDDKIPPETEEESTKETPVSTSSPFGFFNKPPQISSPFRRVQSESQLDKKNPPDITMLPSNPSPA